jgi:hypothetical protein
MRILSTASRIMLDVLVAGGADHRRRQECHDDGEQEVPCRRIAGKVQGKL